MKPIKKELEALKHKQKWTWKEMGQALGVEHNTLSFWSKGFVNEIKPKNLDRLKEVMAENGIEINL